MDKKLRVAVYCRVGNADEREMNAYLLQRNRYIAYIKARENWEFAGVYTDYGLDVANRPRPDYDRMLAACRAGRIDLIMTKNVSRIHRNAVDAIRLIRELSELEPPVGFYFEETELNTLDLDGDMLAYLMARTARKESRNKSKRLPFSDAYDDFQRLTEAKGSAYNGV